MAPRATLNAEPTRPVKLLNRMLAPLGDDFPSVSFDAFARIAENTTRLSDWGDDAAVARFKRCALAVEASESLSTWGRISLRIYLQSKYVNHLRRIAFVKAHPEVREVPVDAPLVIFGWYRTGTTLLHNLLTADPAHRAARTWELCFPIPLVDDPRRDETLRKAATAFILNANRAVVPEQANAHYVEVSSPEECFFLFENAGASTTLFNTYHAYDYGFSLLEEDLRPVYAEHKLQLQILSLAAPRKRWVLKCPFHLWALDALVHTYPDATLIQTHRHVGKSLPSNCSLSAITTSKFVDRMDLVEHGRFWNEFYARGMERGLATRRRLGPGRIIDVRTNDLSRDPLSSIRSIYAAQGLPFTRELERAYADRAAQHPKDAHGKHVYTPEDFGLNAAELAARYADYHAEFGLLDGAPSKRDSSPSDRAF